MGYQDNSNEDLTLILIYDHLSTYYFSTATFMAGPLVSARAEPPRMNTNWSGVGAGHLYTRIGRWRQQPSAGRQRNHRE